MPLISGSSNEAVSENIKRETEAGKPHKQAIAIALAMKRRAEGMTKPHVTEPKAEDTNE